MKWNTKDLRECCMKEGWYWINYNQSFENNRQPEYLVISTGDVKPRPVSSYQCSICKKVVRFEE